ncbi:hypothetical protein KSK55_03980 [Methanospirillum purgamenti]|jgi:hypothetical protein|uniref:NurA domain-containing protein n=1 Tax=Methanospirillum hungatei TaxID=2203 RepID=A0A8F5VQT7_METHU|nr:hypothetical protein [Methanospirillum hungatei]QXO95568.1 hypothetical protein KSK55_03980 [Methanospirillum hungatei]
MPYQQGSRLPGERASRLGHLEVMDYPLVKQLLANFNQQYRPEECNTINWSPLPAAEETLKYIFVVDGSLQQIDHDQYPYSSVSFIKTALLKLDTYALEKVDPETPHPFVIQDILRESVTSHSTILPLRNTWTEGKTIYDTIRDTIYHSICDTSPNMDGQILDTLKWIAYKKWSDSRDGLPEFQCPYGHEDQKHLTSLPYDSDKGICSVCGNEIYITDFLGFHLDMGEDSAPPTIASTYMIIHETLLLFTALRIFWENHKDLISECLFIKDGPLSIRAQYSKLVEPIRQFFEYAKTSGYPIHMMGQEKSGMFYDHLQFLGPDAPKKSFLLLQDEYIKKHIQCRPIGGAPYGKDTNYGAKLFIKQNNYHMMVLNIPFGKYKQNPQPDDLIGYTRIISTIPKIISNRYEGALLPIELANNIASLSTYPSSKMLKLFSESQN